MRPLICSFSSYFTCGCNMKLRTNKKCMENTRDSTKKNLTFLLDLKHYSCASTCMQMCKFALSRHSCVDDALCYIVLACEYECVCGVCTMYMHVYCFFVLLILSDFIWILHCAGTEHPIPEHPNFRERCK